MYLLWYLLLGQINTRISHIFRLDAIFKIFSKLQNIFWVLKST